MGCCAVIGNCKGNRDGGRRVGFDPGKRQGLVWIISQCLQRHMGWNRIESTSKVKDHCKKLKQKRWFQLGRFHAEK